jgi:hypothetical protein
MITIPVNPDTLIPAVKWKGITESVPIPPGYNSAVITGEVSGIFVVDLDEKNGKSGTEEIAKLGELPDTYTVRTPSGGYHLYFNHPGKPVYCSAGVLGPGVDIRGDGGIVHAPGSVRTDGVYEVINDVAIADAPEWLLSRVLHRITKDVEPVAVEFKDDPRLTHRAVEYLRKAEPCVQGSSGSAQLWKICRKLVTGYKISPERALGLLEDYNDRCSPPWTHEELLHKLNDAATKTRVPVAVFTLDTTKSDKPKSEYVHAFEPCHSVPAPEIHKISFGQIVSALSSNPEWSGVLRYDTFKNKILAVDPPLILDMETIGMSSADIGGILCWFENKGYTTGKETLALAIETAAHGNPFHPVREYLDALPEGDADDLNCIASDLLGAKQEIENLFFRKMLIAAIARIYQPGCKHDNVLLLYGAQGIRKSSLCRQLFGPWFRDQLPELSNRDASMALLGIWGAEIPELDRLNRQEGETVKEFLSRPVDQYRDFGKADQIERPRQCVFIGTTNDPQILRDLTGNRRWHIIECNRIIPEVDRDKIWSAAKAAYMAGETWWIDDEEDEKEAEETRKSFMLEDAWMPEVLAWVVKHNKEKVLATEVIHGIFPISEFKNMDDRGMKRIARCLRSLGCMPLKSHGRNYWVIPEEHRSRLKLVKP